MTKTIRRELKFPQSPEEVWRSLTDSTRVSYRLERDGTGTRVLFEHTGFEQEPAFKGAAYGWTVMHGKLVKVLDTKGADR